MNPAEIALISAVQPSAYPTELVQQRVRSFNARSNTPQATPALSGTRGPEPKATLLALQLSRNLGKVPVRTQVRQGSDIGGIMQLILLSPQLCVALFAVGSAAGIRRHHVAWMFDGRRDHHACQGVARKGGVLTIRPANRCSNRQIVRRGYEHDLGSALASIRWIGAR